MRAKLLKDLTKPLRSVLTRKGLRDSQPCSGFLEVSSRVVNGSFCASPLDGDGITMAQEPSQVLRGCLSAFTSERVRVTICFTRRDPLTDVIDIDTLELRV
jgi:hypothetical protein